MSVVGKSDDYHVKRFLSKSAARKASILKKYARLEKFGTRKELLRHACHSCAWVTCLPLDVVVTDFGGLSPISVCTEIIQSCGHGRLSDRLKESLARLRVKIVAVLSEQSISSESRICWKQLQQCLPKLGVEMKRVEDLYNTWSVSTPIDKKLALVENDLGNSDANIDARRSRAIRRLHKYHCQFVNSAQQALDVDELLLQVREASRKGDAVSMCHLLLKGAAWLARPRLRAQVRRHELMTEAAKWRLRAALQTKIRRIILVCLNGLDLEDPGTCARSDVQASVLQIQEVMHGVQLDQVKASKHWSMIRSFISSMGTHGENSDVSLQRAPKRMGQWSRKLAASAKGDKFAPAHRLQQSTLVVHGPLVTLICQGCQKRLQTDWYFRKKSGELRVIVPGSGHFPSKQFVCGHYYPEDKSLNFTSDKTVVRHIG